MNEEEIIKDIRETNYNEQNAEELLYELKNDTGTYSCYDNAMAIIYYKNLYKQEKEKNKELAELYKSEKSMKCYYVGLYQDIVIKENCISKDKIKEKIEETNNEKLNYSEDEYYLENEIKGYAIDKLKELLEEE